MNSRSFATQLSELIDANEKEFASIEQMIKIHGLLGFFQQLNDDLPLSSECLEKLRALKLIINQTVPLSWNGGNKYGNPPFA